MWQERLANGKFCVVLDIEEWRAGIRTTVTYNRGQPKQLIIHDEINHCLILPSPLKRAGEGDFICIFNIRSHRKSMSKPGNFNFSCKL